MRQPSAVEWGDYQRPPKDFTGDHAVGFAKTRLSFALDRVKDKDEQAADAIRDVLDQVTGYCSAHLRLSGPKGEPSDRELLDGFLASTEPVGPDEFVDEASGPNGDEDG